ncbi:Ig-like domain-containing protein [Anaeromyxobacter oryzae]|uniref:Ig-like domain-containing protein n=1 Tax=Anaeromyxobacter oryzae TaxID=2918170 RepID=A0ABM7WPF8_9BACT|nr:Ig-like domain-containing protein [Anaeromyxobacter oryzae]BDG01344.1 hypothetical protein AMOR_03400 [Anaeromyxobacter oryzae]
MRRSAIGLAWCGVVLLAACGRSTSTEPQAGVTAAAEAGLFEPLGVVPACLETARGCSSGVALAGPDAAGPEVNGPHTLGSGCPGVGGSGPAVQAIAVASADGAPIATGSPVEADVTVSGTGFVTVQRWHANDATRPWWEELPPDWVDLGEGAEATVRTTFEPAAGGLHVLRAVALPAGASDCEAFGDSDDLVFAVEAGHAPAPWLLASPGPWTVVTGDVPLAIRDAGLPLTRVEYVLENELVVSEQAPTFPALWSSPVREAGPALVQAYAFDETGGATFDEVRLTLATAAGCDASWGVPACDAPTSACGSGRALQGGGAAEGCGDPTSGWWGCPERLDDPYGPFIERMVVFSRDGQPLAPGVSARLEVELGGPWASDPGGWALALDLYVLDEEVGWTLLQTFSPPNGIRHGTDLRIAPSRSDPGGRRVVRAVVRDGGAPGTCDGAVIDDDVLAFVAPDLAPPLVALASPADLAVVATPVQVRAAARDAGGVDCVTFLVDDVPAAGACAPPYEAAVDLGAGQHRLTARATDRAGNAATSAAATVTADLWPPFVVITGLAPGQAVEGVVQIDVGASDDVYVAGVELRVDGVTVGSRTELPWSFPWDTTSVTAGPHTLVAVARDAAGREGASDPVEVVIDPPPIITLTSPADGEVLYGPATLAAEVSGGQPVLAVDFLVDGAVVASVAAPPFQASWAPSALGRYRVSACACESIQALTAATGPCSCTPEIEISFDVIRPVDLGPPAVALTSPPAGALVSGTVALGASAMDDVGVTGVSFYVDGVLVGRDEAPPYEAAWDSTPFPGRTVLLRATATDAAGNVGASPEQAITVADAPPKVEIASPGPGAVLFKTAELTARAEDDLGVVRVDWYADGQLVGAVTAPPWRFLWDVRKVPRGAHALTARALDTTGHATASAAVPVYVK